MHPASVNPTDVYISQIPCPQGADLNTGFVYGTTNPASDAGPCIANYLRVHVAPNHLLILHQDGASVSSGIFGPTEGWGIVSDMPPGISVVTILACKISSNLISCETKPNHLAAGQGAILNGFSADSHLNQIPIVISSEGLSRTRFQAMLVHSDANVGAGEIQILHGNGFFQKAASNADIINNGMANPPCPGGYEDPGWNTPGPAPERGSGLVFRNLMLNGNRLHNSTTGNLTGVGGFTATYNVVPYCFYIGLNIYDVNNVDIDGNYFFQTSAYNLRLMNVGFAAVTHNKFDEFGPGADVYESNSDGLHVSAPANNITADGNYFKTGDDAWALNAAEGWVGPITYVTITNSQYEQSLSGGRMYTYSIPPPPGDAAPRIDHVLVNGGVGTVQVVPHIIGNEGAHTLTVGNTMSDVVFANERISMVRGAYTGALASGNGIVVADNIADITFDNVQIDNIRTTASAPGFINLTDSANVTALNLTNVTVTRSAAGHSVQAIVDLKTGYYSPPGINSIHQLAINGARVFDLDDGAYGKAPYVVNSGTSTIGILSVNGIDFSNLDALVSDASRVTTFQGQSLSPGGRPYCASNIKMGAGSGQHSTCDTVSQFEATSTR
jgi:hypothetical protein